MLGLVTLAFFIIVSIKLSFELKSHKQIFLKHEVSTLKILSLQLSPVLYIISLIGLLLPVSWFDYLRPIPTGILLLMPGIILGRNISEIMDRVGFSDEARAGRDASNIMWLGIAVVILIICVIVVRLLFNNISSEFPI